MPRTLWWTHRVVTAVMLLALAALMLSLAVPAHAATVRVRATFTPGRTDGLSKVAGQVRIVQADGGTIYAIGKVTGLPAYAALVVVPYIGKGCLPVPGVLAFPSTPFVTDATGTGRIRTQVNPKAINPVGSFTAGQTGSVSIRSVVLPARNIAGTPTPTIPNVGAVEACDSNPTRI